MSLTYITEDFDIEVTSNLLLTESVNTKSSITVLVRAISPTITKNGNKYTEEGLTEVVYNLDGEPSGPTSFVTPYPKPIVVNHDLKTEALGRIRHAYWDSAESAIMLHLNIAGEENVEKVLDERYLTTSVGTLTNKVVCATCNFPISDKKLPCPDHPKSVSTPWEIGNIWGKEISFVNLPAFSNSRVIKVEKTTENTNKVNDQKEFSDIDISNTSEMIDMLIVEHDSYHKAFRDHGTSKWLVHRHSYVTWKLRSLMKDPTYINEHRDSLDDTV